MVSVYNDTDLEKDSKPTSRKNSRGSLPRARSRSRSNSRNRQDKEKTTISETHDLCQISIGGRIGDL